MYKYLDLVVYIKCTLYLIPVNIMLCVDSIAVIERDNLCLLLSCRFVCVNVFV